jgi:oligopeptide transport system substrate-binding protein
MRSIFIVYSILLLLSACSSEEKTTRKAVGGKYYGGDLKFMSSERVDNLFPASSVDIYTQRLNAQIYESLVKLDVSSMKIVPSIAESFEMSDDGKTYTFKIRKGVRFHEDDCFHGKPREVTAKDVKYTLEFACSGLAFNKMSYLLVNRIEGAAEFYKKSEISLPKSGVSGIKVLNKRTIQIKLDDPFIGFDKILAHTNLGIFPREAFEKYGANITKNPVGTGPFMLDVLTKNGVTLKRNDHYWRKDKLGNQLPFLNKIVMTYVKDKKSEILAFRKKEIDLVLEIPVDYIATILGTLKEAQNGKNVKHKVISSASMSINFVAFNCESPEFKNPDVRKACNMAINRNEIVEKWLLGEGWAANNGFVPSMDNFANEKVIGYSYNVAKAQQLLAKAGFPKGKGFPVLDFYVNAIQGSSVHKMCIGIAQQLQQNLNIRLKIKLCSLVEREKAIASGKAKIWRSGWLADYSDPENFLSLFYSGKNLTNSAQVNNFRFRNKIYDSLFEAALKELDEENRNDLLGTCDQMVIDEAPVMPIMTDDFMVIINTRIRDFKTNSMENLDFSELFILEPRSSKK